MGGGGSRQDSGDLCLPEGKGVARILSGVLGRGNHSEEENESTFGHVGGPGGGAWRSAAGILAGGLGSPAKATLSRGGAPTTPPGLSDEPPLGGQKARRATAWFCGLGCFFFVFLYFVFKSSNFDPGTCALSPISETESIRSGSRRSEKRL